jgi:DUF1365 family protein
VTGSALYVGRLTHARRSPRPHAFQLPLYLLYLDLEELETARSSWLFGVEAARPLSFRRRDFLGQGPLRKAVADEVEQALGRRPRGPIRLLAHVRSFGYAFNPAAFYFCFEEGGQTLAAVVVEVTNTPWGERHRYVLPAGPEGVHSSHAKAFHVSPFFPMTQRYEWEISTPGESLSVRIGNRESGTLVFGASLALERRPFSQRELLRAALRMPLVTWAVHAAIYWQALRLWLKRTPIFDHPLHPPLGRLPGPGSTPEKLR